jgi:hypothetical protein
MNLPTKKVAPKESNPKFTILFGKPKCGKTTIISGLENALIIDLENGTDYVECMSIKVNSLQDLRDAKAAIIDANKKKGDFEYTYGIIDTATKLEDMILPLALSMYQKTPMGKTFTDDIRSLPMGGGYLYIREAFKQVIDSLKPLFKYFILLGHTKDKNITKQGKELSENSIDLSGKLERIISADADALGYVYRSKNQTIINFNGGGDSIVEARPLHLRGKEIIIAESDDKGNLKFNWDKIFINN